jgi:hypothetical protein
VAKAKGPPTPFLERLGSGYLRAGTEAAAVADDPIHVLNPSERAALLRVVRGAIFRAALAGVLNAVATGFGEIYARQHLGHMPDHATLLQQAKYWGVYGVAAIVFAVLEIAYLYWDGLRAVRKLSLVAGLELSAEENSEVALALARAALELPNPPEAVLGVNPHREASKAQLVFASLVYKLKISVTNFLFKALLQRALGRFATRHLLAFSAVPINALWNALVCWSVLREARIRVMGPSAALELLEAALEHEPKPSAQLVAAIHHAVGSAIVRTRALHPNHVAMLRVARDRLGPPAAGLELDDSRAFLRDLSKLSDAEKRVALRVLAAAAILDGRLVRTERRLLAEAYAAAGVEPGLTHVEKLRRAFVAGDVIPRDELRRVAI